MNIQNDFELYEKEEKILTSQRCLFIMQELVASGRLSCLTVQHCPVYLQYHNSS